MYAYATFLVALSLLIGLPNVLRANQQVRMEDLASAARPDNLYLFFQGALSYQRNTGTIGALANASIVPAYVPSFYNQYAANGVNIWAAQARAYGTKTLVIAYGDLGGSGASAMQAKTRSALCGRITGGALVVPRAGASGQITLGPASSPAINLNSAPWSIADGLYACARIV